MRDDIHKSAPVSAKWRKFLKHCASECDRDERACESAQEAVVTDCKELTRQFVETLLERINGPDRELFGSILDGLDMVAGSVLEQQTLNRLRLVEQAGPLNRGTVELAVAEVLSERVDNQRRAMLGHVLKTGGRDVAECVGAVNRHLSSMDTTAYAKQLLANSGRIEPRPKPTPVGLDEDLTR